MDAKQLTKFALDCLEDLKAQNIVTLDVTGASPITDTLIIASGTSKPHVKAIASNLKLQVKQNDLNLVGYVGEENGEWILADLGDLVVHVMLPEVRAYYELEKLWSVTE